jgi:hypothetical protein
MSYLPVYLLKSLKTYASVAIRHKEDWKLYNKSLTLCMKIKSKKLKTKVNAGVDRLLIKVKFP